MNTRPRVSFIALLTMLPVLSMPPMQESAAQTTSRGAKLYDNHCIQCHDSEVHWRRDSKVRTRADLVRMVERWQFNLGLDWDKSMIADVADYLDHRYYRLPSG